MRKLALGVAVVALVVPALAVAAKPRPNANYGQDGVIKLVVDPSGKQFYWQAKTKCGKKLGPRDLPPVKVKRGGEYKLRMTNIPSRAGKLTVSLEGKFVTRDLTKGTLKVKVGKCEDKLTKFKAAIIE